MTDENNGNGAPPAEGEGEGKPEGEGASNSITLGREEYDKLITEHGSYKRELRELKKPKEEPAKDTPQKTEPDNLLQKTYLRAAQITAEDEVELALSLSKKWDVPLDKLVDDEDFVSRLEKLRTKKSNETATANIKGGAGKSGAIETVEYWAQKGTLPTKEDVPDRKKRVQIIEALASKANTSGKTFYND